MDNRDLDPALVERYKTACDQAVQAVGTPSHVAGLLGLNPSTLSRAISPNHPEVLLTAACALMLERLSGRPVFAAMFASLTYHHVVPDDDGPGDEDEKPNLVEAISNISREHSEAVVALADVAQRPTPSSARRAMKEISESISEKQRVMSSLAPIAARARA